MKKQIALLRLCLATVMIYSLISAGNINYGKIMIKLVPSPSLLSTQILPL